MTDDVSRKQNCQDDHGWQGKSLPVVTGHAGTGRQSSLSEAKLWEAGGWALQLEKKKASQQGRTQSRCVFEAGRLPKHGKLISLQGTQLEGKAVLSHLHPSLQLSEVSTCLEDLFHEHLLGGLYISLLLMFDSLAGIGRLILETRSSHLPSPHQMCPKNLARYKNNAAMHESLFSYNSLLFFSFLCSWLWRLKSSRSSDVITDPVGPTHST